MGYYSRFDLRTDAPESERKAVDAAISADISSDDHWPLSCVDVGRYYGAAGEAKWYTCDEDIARLAKQFPGITFTVRQRGEDAMDPRVFVHCHGEPKRGPLTRDVLLAEISRSLRETCPDRAEELTVALERGLVERATIDGWPCHLARVGGMSLADFAGLTHRMRMAGVGGTRTFVSYALSPEAWRTVHDRAATYHHVADPDGDRR